MNNESANNLKLKYYAPLFFFFSLLFDGQFSSIIESIARDRYYTVSMMVILLMILGTVNLSKLYLVSTAFVIGFLYDIYFIGILGINLFLYPLIAYWIYKLKKIISRSISTQLMTFIVTISIYQTLLMLLQSMFKLAQIRPILFIVSILGPSLIFNVILFFIFIWPLRWIFRVKSTYQSRLKKEVDLSENQSFNEQ